RRACGSSSAHAPIHRHAFSGSTKNSHTVSGRAAIAISRSIAVVVSLLVVLTAAPFFAFRLALQGVETVVPQLLEERPQRREALGPHAVQAPRAVAAHLDEPGGPEHLEVLGDRLLADVEVGRDLADRTGLVADEAQDRRAAGLGERFEDGLGAHRERECGSGGVVMQVLTCESARLAFAPSPGVT